MLSRSPRSPRNLLLALTAALLAAGSARAQLGPILTGIGPVNVSMGGASVAGPLDATGALYWNPATMSGLPTDEVDVGVSIIYPQTRLSSSLPAGGLGPGVPATALSGSDRGDNGVFPIPSIGLLYKPEGSNLTVGMGLGVFLPIGFGVNYPASISNPILTAPPPHGVGLGPVYSELEVLQLAPAASYQVTDHLSVGVEPLVNLAFLRADPGVLAAPEGATFPPATHERSTWGAGVQAGVYYTLDGGWRLGASVKSPQWFEDFRYQTLDAQGRPRTFTFNFDTPMIPSVGLAYSGIEHWLFAADFRYVDFHNTAGFRGSGFAPDGSVQGLGWRSIFAIALGVQYQYSEALSFRMGYTFNQNPIGDVESSFNVASPTIVQHVMYVGASYQITDQFSMSAAYTHGFENSITGPYETPLGAVPGSSVTNTLVGDSFLIGATVKFGPKCAGHPAPVEESVPGPGLVGVPPAVLR